MIASGISLDKYIEQYEKGYVDYACINIKVSTVPHLHWGSVSLQ